METSTAVTAAGVTNVTDITDDDVSIGASSASFASGDTGMTHPPAVHSNGDTITSITTSSPSQCPSTKLLCGYLCKMSGKGPLRGLKKRWFIHSNSDCKLKYYRAKGDLVPLGEIDVRRATFSISPLSGQHHHHHHHQGSSPFTFTITTLDKEYILGGEDQESTLFWIRELQRLRKEYIVNLASDFGIKLRPSHLDDGSMDPEITEVKRSNSRFYVTEDLDREINNRQPKRSITDDALSHRQSRQSTHPHPPPPSSSSSHQHSSSGFTSSLLSRVRHRAESLTRGSNSTPANKSSMCDKCREKEDQLINLSDDLTAVENELQATREVVHLLQRQLDVVQNEKTKLQGIVRSTCDSKNTDIMLESLSNLELEVGDSNAKIKSMQRMFDRLNNEYEKVQEERKKMTEEIQVLRDTVEAKDKTVITLTNEIFDLEANGQPSIGFAVSPPPSSFTRQESIIKIDSPEVDQLKDSLQAYKMQNEFLNQEIVAVNELRLMSEKRSQEMQGKSYEWEAKCCQIQSKLLSLLKEINQSISKSTYYEDDRDPQSGRKEEVILSEGTIDLVKRLLDDISLNIPLSWQKGNRSRNDQPSIIAGSKFNHQEYDDLGFSSIMRGKSGSCHGPGQENDDAAVDEADIMQQELSERSRVIAAGAASSSGQPVLNARQSWKSRWDSYVGSLANNSDLVRSQELKFLLRSGIPREYRCKMWKGLIHLRVKNTRERLGPEYYKRLLMQSSNARTGTAGKSYDPHVKQIELDLLRTLPNNKHFESLESDGTCRLRRVLTAYARHNQHVGYCQGLNRLAAVSLLFMPEEEGEFGFVLLLLFFGFSDADKVVIQNTAFWSLVAIIEHLMPPDYYSMNLLGAHVDQHVFRDLLAEKLPKVHEVLEKFGIEVSLFSWFLTCFVDNIPVEVYLRIWDVFLYEGNKVLFRFALAFFKLHEQEIMDRGSTDSVQVNTLIRTLGEGRCDVRSLCRIAFTFLNPFPMNRVRAKRQHYTIMVKSELERLDQIRRTLPSYDSSMASASMTATASAAGDIDDGDSD